MATGNELLDLQSLPPVRPWSGKKLERLGKAIRDGVHPPSGGPSYDDVMAWYNDLATWVQVRIEQLDWEPLLGSAVPKLVSRPKTIDTLRQKLQPARMASASPRRVRKNPTRRRERAPTHSYSNAAIAGMTTPDSNCLQLRGRSASTTDGRTGVRI